MSAVPNGIWYRGSRLIGGAVACTAVYAGTELWSWAVTRVPPAPPVMDDFVESRDVSRRRCQVLPGYDVVVRYHFLHKHKKKEAELQDPENPSMLETMKGWLAGGKKDAWLGFDAKAAAAQEQAFREAQRAVDQDSSDSNGMPRSAELKATANLNVATPRRVAADGALYYAQEPNPEDTTKFTTMAIVPTASGPTVDDDWHAAAGGDAQVGGVLAALTASLDDSTQQSLIQCQEGYAGGADVAAEMKSCVNNGATMCPMYLRVMMSAFALQPFPLPSALSVLQLGVAGGSMGMFLQRYIPHHIQAFDLVDIEPAVFQAASADMGLEVTSANAAHTRFHAEDAEDYLVRAARKYDVLMVDTFVGADVPDHLRTPSFIELVSRSLTESGVAAFNLPYRDKRFVSAVERRFGRGNVFVVPVPKCANVVVLAAKNAPGNGMSQRHLLRRSTELSTQLGLPYDIGAHMPLRWLIW
jgi:spermidine synthase